MKNLKKVLSLVLALAMAASLMTFAFAADADDFKDYDEVTYNEAVDVMYALGVFNGVGDGTNFDPNGTLTREQAAKIITYMIAGQTEADKLVATIAPYSDVAATRWSAGSIAYCTSEGIIAGTGDDTFNPTGELTGLAFAKMLLTALGYDAEIEQLTGPSWAINTAKLAVTAGLTKGLDISLTDPMTREEAAQMALNAEKATMVEYGTMIGVNVGDANVTIAGSKASPVANLAATETIENDNYMQFAEQYADKLVLSTSHDDLGRPADQWVYNNKLVGDYANEPAVVYTAYLNDEAGQKQVRSDLRGYSYKTTAAGVNDVTFGGNVSGTPTIDGYDDVAALTQNGRAVEVYVTDNIITDVVAIDSTLVEVKKVTEDEVTFSGTTAKVTDDEDLFSFFSGMEREDKVVLVLDSTTVLDAYTPDTVTGEFSKTKGSGATVEYTVGGEAYQAIGTTGNSTLNNTSANLGNTYTLILDQYGYIMDVTDEVVSDVYAYVLDTSANVNRGDYDYALNLLFSDGTTKWVDAAEVTGSLNGTTYNDDVVADGDVDAADFADLKDNFVSYTEGDDGYDVTVETSAPASGTITKGNSTIFTSYTASNATIFLVKNDSSYTVYTGIKNVPSMTVAANDAVVLHDSNVALIVVIDNSASTSNEDQVFIYNTTPQGVEKDGAKTVTFYKAIVNGEDTTIGVMTHDGTSTANSDVAVGLFVNNSYSGDYISDLGAKHDGTETTSGTVLTYTVDDSSLSDVTLKNGLLTVAGVSPAVVKVVADEFDSYIIAGTNNEVDTLALDDEKTFAADGSEGYVLATGDYVTIILDDDGYVTDLYLYDASL